MNQVKFLTQAFVADNLIEAEIEEGTESSSASLEKLILNLKKTPLLPAFSAHALLSRTDRLRFLAAQK